MQRHELDAWLGTDHGLTAEQIDELLAQADEIEERHDGDQDEMREALITAHRVLLGDSDEVADLAKRRTDARAAEAQAVAGLRQAAAMLINGGAATESGFARQAGVDRMTVRKWLGK